MLRNYVKKGFVTVGLVLFMIAGLIGCELSENGQPLDLTAPADVADLSNFIMGRPEITEWGAQYTEGNAYFMVNIPVRGALKVEYGIKNGGVFAIFLEAMLPVEVEIGLVSSAVTTTAESPVGVLDWVCVTYAEGARFASIPGNAAPDTARDGAWTHYQRKAQNPDTGQDEVFPWWLPDAQFGFGGATQRVCVIEGSRVVVQPVSGPFPKPEPPAPAPTSACPGDADCDGVPDATDNCPTVPNPQQVATDPNSGCRLIDNNDGTVTDITSSYMWERVANGVVENWPTATGATGHCATSVLGTYTDWRLPTLAELRSLIDTSQALPSGHPFTVQPTECYWTSDTFALPPVYVGYAWFLIPAYNFANVSDWTNVFFVWCVRG